MASGVRASRGSAKGAPTVTRRRALLVVFGFVIVAIGVITRRIFGISQATAVRALEVERDGVAAARVKLEADIRDASSRARLVPIAEKRLHMYVPSDSQVIIVPRKPE